MTTCIHNGQPKKINYPNGHFYICPLTSLPDPNVEHLTHLDSLDLSNQGTHFTQIKYSQLEEALNTLFLDGSHVNAVFFLDPWGTLERLWSIRQTSRLKEFHAKI